LYEVGMNIDMTRMQVRVRVTGVLDGARAMEVLSQLARLGTQDAVIDFSGIRQFESFGVEVLVRGLAGLGNHGARVRCAGLPPCVAERLRAEGVIVAESLGRPRWAPWGS
jgi:anti-anti-sigma regulatory factor